MITQVAELHADRTQPGEQAAGRPSSSATLPGLLVQMYRHAYIRDGMDILDVGTGSGYGTALLATRLGDQRYPRQQRADAQPLVAGGHDVVPGAEHVLVDGPGREKVWERAAGYLGQPHRRRARAEAGQQEVKVAALGDSPVDALAWGHEGHLKPPETEGSVT
jgi:hypothetical protein